MELDENDRRKSFDDPPYWVTDVSEVADDDVYIRGYKLADVMGRLPFAAATYLVVRGKIPTPGESRLMDAMLCSVLDYSLKKPGTVAARYVVSANASMAAGLAVASLAMGDYTLAPDATGRFIQESFARYRDAGGPMDRFARTYVADFIAQGRRVPGFGHPNFEYVDPRAQRLKQIAQDEGCWTELADWYEETHRAFVDLKGRPDIPINDVGMIGAIMSGMGFTPDEMNGLLLISTLPGAIAHISEELQSETRIRVVPDASVQYRRARADLDADLNAAGWDESGSSSGSAT